MNPPSQPGHSAGRQGIYKGARPLIMKAQYIKITEDGNKFYFSDKEMEIRHREDGPAIEWTDGGKEWYLNDRLHREDGPAVEYLNGDKWCYLNGKYHREDGPAIEWADGDKEWRLNGIEYSEEEFNKKMKPSKKININGREFTVEQLNNLIALAEK